MARGVALLLTLLLATAGIAAGGRRGLRVLRSEVPDACDVRVGRGDSVAYHYSGRAAGGEGEDGELTIADTAIVGRPIEAVISGGEDRGLPAAIEEALVGASRARRTAGECRDLMKGSSCSAPSHFARRAVHTCVRTVRPL